MFTFSQGQHITQLSQVISDLNDNVLTQLKLQSNNIGTEGIRALSEALKANYSLTQLDLRSNNIDAEGIRILSEALKVNDSLTQLDVSDNHIGDSGAEMLSKVLKENHSLTCLELGNNGIGIDGAKMLSKMLEENHSLMQLNLSRNNFGSEGVQAFLEALKKNYYLTEINLCRNYTDIEDFLMRRVLVSVARNRQILEEKNPIKKANLIRKKGGSYQVPSLISLSLFTINTNFSAKEIKNCKNALPKKLYLKLRACHKNCVTAYSELII